MCTVLVTNNTPSKSAHGIGYRLFIIEDDLSKPNPKLELRSLYRDDGPRQIGVWLKSKARPMVDVNSVKYKSGWYIFSTLAGVRAFTEEEGWDDGKHIVLAKVAWRGRVCETKYEHDGDRRLYKLMLTQEMKILSARRLNDNCNNLDCPCHTIPMVAKKRTTVAKKKSK